MNYLFEGFLNILLGALGGIFDMLSTAYMAYFGINIGAKFSGMVAVNGETEFTLTEDAAAYEETMSSIGHGNSLFDTLFPAAAKFMYVMTVTGLCLCAVLGIYGLIRSLYADPNEAEHPVKVVGRTIIGTIMTYFAYPLIVTCEYVGNNVYLAFNQTAMNMDYSHPDPEQGFGISKMFQPESLENTLDVLYGQTFGSVAILIVGLISILVLMIEFTKLLLEITERYVVLGVLIYTSPVFFAFSAARETRDVFKSWMRMVLSEFILMITNSFFIVVFLSGLSYGLGEIRTKNSDFSVYFAALIMLVAWAKAGQKFDEYLKGIGLSTAQHGSNLLGAVAGAVLTLNQGSTLLKKAKGTRVGGAIAGAITSGIGAAFRGDDVGKAIKQGATEGWARACEKGAGQGYGAGSGVETRPTYNDGSVFRTAPTKNALLAMDSGLRKGGTIKQAGDGTWYGYTGAEDSIAGKEAAAYKEAHAHPANNAGASEGAADAPQSNQTFGGETASTGEAFAANGANAQGETSVEGGPSTYSGSATTSAPVRNDEPIDMGHTAVDAVEADGFSDIAHKDGSNYFTAKDSEGETYALYPKNNIDTDTLRKNSPGLDQSPVYGTINGEQTQFYKVKLDAAGKPEGFHHNRMVAYEQNQRKLDPWQQSAQKEKNKKRNKPKK